MNLLQVAKKLAKDLHSHQTDWAGSPYWQHVFAVMDDLPEDSPDERKIIALLHDAIEDSWDMILQMAGYDPNEFPDGLTHDIANKCADYFRELGFSDHTVDGILLVTRIPNEMTYMNKIKKLVDSGHIDAMHVKLADNKQNTHPDRYNSLPEDKRIMADQMRPRYERSMQLLRKGLSK